MAKRYKKSNGLFDAQAGEEPLPDEVAAVRSESQLRLATRMANDPVSVYAPWKDPIKEALETANAIFGPLPPDIGEQTAGTGPGQKTHELIHFEQQLLVLGFLMKLDGLEDGETRDWAGLALRTGRLLALCEVRAKSGLYKGRLRSRKGLRPREASIDPEAVRDAYERIRSANPHLSKASAVKHVAKRIGCCERSVWDLLPKKKH